MEHNDDRLSPKIVILTPVFNDWASFRLLIDEIDRVLRENDLTASVLAVDDGSTLLMDQRDFSHASLETIKEVSVIELARNLGHQRAIALGLTYINFNVACDAVVVMDADGEDSPSAIPRLIEKCRETDFSKIIFARRAKRSEGATFRLFYVIYRLLFRMLTGHEIRFGNFSILPFQSISRLVCVSEIWNHYSVGVVKARIPFVEIAVSRSARLAGESRMSFVSLVSHGLSAISVYSDVVGIRLLFSALFLIVASVAGILGTVAVRLFTDLAIPGWATTLTGILFIVALQACGLSIFFVFIVLNSRNIATFVPARDYLPFILQKRTAYSVHD